MARKPVKKNLLHSITFDEVSAVDDGANEGSRVVIAKRAEPHTPTLKETDMRTRFEKNEDEEFEGGDYDARDDRDEALDLAADALEEAEKAFEELEDEVQKARDTIERYESIMKAKGIDIEEAESEEIAKRALPKAIQKQLEKAELTEQIEKGKAIGFGDPKVVGPLLDRIEKKLGSADAETFTRLLKSASAIRKNAGAFEALGVDGDAASDTAEGKLNAITLEIAKSRQISFQKAQAAAIEENPDLYREYRIEKRAAR